ncbi:MAG: ROK family protein [Clostridia bacterium]|nr:ROK family protein [Clostridia bacterium]
MAKTVVSIGVDQGGTKLMIGAVTSDGSIVEKTTFPTGFREQYKTADAIFKGLEAFLADKDWEICGIGMGIVGEIDTEKGIWKQMYGLDTDAPVAVYDEIRQRFGVPCRIDNDVKTAMLAVRKFEIAPDCNDFAYVNVGTGISGAFVVDGHLLRGDGNNAGEIGQYPVKMKDGTIDNVEDVASGGGMMRRVRALAADYPNDPATEVRHTGELYRLADEGSPLAVEITETAAESIAMLLVNVMATCSPKLVIVGGGTMRDGWLFKKVISKMPKTVYCENTEIRLSGLDLSTIGLIGAALNGFEAAK